MEEKRAEDIQSFYVFIKKFIDNGMSYRDAIELSAVTVGGLIPSRVSRAMAKYQEATHPQSHLSKEEDKDALALLSMGVLWDNEYFSPIEKDSDMLQEDTLAEAVYFVMQYGSLEAEKAHILEASAKQEGDVVLREEMIRRILGEK